MNTRRSALQVSDDEIVSAVAAFGLNGVGDGLDPGDDGNDYADDHGASDFGRMCVALGVSGYGTGKRSTSDENAIARRLHAMASVRCGVEFNSFTGRVCLTPEEWGTRLTGKDAETIALMLMGVQ